MIMKLQFFWKDVRKHSKSKYALYAYSYSNAIAAIAGQCRDHYQVLLNDSKRNDDDDKIGILEIFLNNYMFICRDA